MYKKHVCFLHFSSSCLSYGYCNLPLPPFPIPCLCVAIYFLVLHAYFCSVKFRPFIHLIAKCHQHLFGFSFWVTTTYVYPSFFWTQRSRRQFTVFYSLNYGILRYMPTFYWILSRPKLLLTDILLLIIWELWSHSWRCKGFIILRPPNTNNHAFMKDTLPLKNFMGIHLSTRKQKP